jgi:hypothetical protein
VLIIDSDRYISAFDYSGNQKSSIRIDKPWYKITSIAFINGFLWATAQTLIQNSDIPDTFLLEHKLYQLDMNLNEIYSQTLRPAGMRRDGMFQNLIVDELLVDEQGVYAYSPISDAAILLDDTLHIVQQKKMPFLYKDAQYGTACIYHVRKGKRHYLSTGYNDFLFCYDDVKNTAYMLSKGFKDDFYKTGQVINLQPIDNNNDFYCYIKSGKDISKKFPDRAKNDDSPVLFLLQMNESL